LVRPYKWIAPAVEELGRTHAGRVKVVRLNIDDAPVIADRHNVRGIPTLLVMQNDQEVDRLTGAAPSLISWPGSSAISAPRGNLTAVRSRGR
jgi:thioredoxin 2